MGRYEPLDPGDGRRDCARLPGVASVARRYDPDELLHDRQGHREVVRSGSRVRELAPGQRLSGCGPGSPGRLRDRRVRRPGQLAPRQLPRDRVPGLHPDALPRAERLAGVHGQRAGDVDGLRPLHEADGVAVHVVYELQPEQGVQVQLQRAGLPRRPHVAGAVAPGRRPDGREGELSAQRVRSQRGLLGRPGLASSHLQLDRPERRRQPLDGCRRRRRRRPHRALEELEDRRRSGPELRRVRDGQGRVHPLHVPPGRLEHASVVRPRPGGTHGGRHLPRPAAQRKDEVASGHALQDPDRLLRQCRLAVGDHDPGRGRCVHGDDERPGRRSLRHVRRRGRPERRRREHGRARLGDGRRDRHAGCGRQAHRPAPLRWRGHGGEPVRPALQQRLLLRSQRLDVARGVGRLALLLRRRPRRTG